MTQFAHALPDEPAPLAVSPDQNNPAAADRSTGRDLLRTGQKAINRLTVWGWIALTAMVVLGTQGCSLMWAFANPAPHHWDNADYLNLEWNDCWAYRFGGPEYHKTGWHGVWDSLINADHNRPPAYRIVAVPFVFLGTALLPTLRAISHLGFWITLYLLYRAAATALDGDNGKVAGLMAVMLASLYSTVGWSIRVFGTEYTLYFSVALMLYSFARATRAELNLHFTWMGLGLAMGLGVLSKLSFVMLAGPAGFVTLYLVANGKLPGLKWWGLTLAVLLGALIAYPWYRFHVREAFNYGQEMTLFTRHSLKESGYSLFKSWIALHINEGLGQPAALLLGLIALVGALALITAVICLAWFQYRTRRPGLVRLGVILLSLFVGSLVLILVLDWYRMQIRDAGDHGQLTAQWVRWLRGEACLILLAGLAAVITAGLACRQNHRTALIRLISLDRANLMILFSLAMGLPLAIFQLGWSQSDNVRHVTPIYFPLTMAVMVLAGSWRLLGAWWSTPLLVLFAVFALGQVKNEFFPLTTTPDDIWDWDPVYQVCHETPGTAVRWPYIGRIGNAGQFNEPSIVYPWARRGDWAVSTWLWQTEDGAFDWGKIKPRLDGLDVVLTAPGFTMPRDGSRLADPYETDNAHNAEFARQLLDDPDWRLARKFPIGIVNRAEIWVFVRKTPRPGHGPDTAAK